MILYARYIPPPPLAVSLLYAEAELTYRLGRPHAGPGPKGFGHMLDLVFLVGGCAFFVAAVLYTTACDKL